MKDHSFRVHQWWLITISKRPVSSKNRLNLYGHSRNTVHSLFCLLFISFFFSLCNLKSILRKQIIMYVGMYRAVCRHVLCHSEDPTCTLCTLQLGWAASAKAVSVDRENVWHHTSYVGSNICCINTCCSSNTWTGSVHFLFMDMNRKCFLRHIYGKAEAEHPFWVVNGVDFFDQSIFNVIILLWLLWLFFLLLLSLLWSTLFFSCSGTDSCLSLCGTKLIFFRACKEKYYVWESWLLQRFQQEIWNLLVWTQLFHFFLSLFVIPLFFSLFNRKKILFVAVRERLVFILSSFMVPICTFLKVLILVYMQNIPVLWQKKTCYKDKNKKNYSITLIFSEHCTVALLCASISEAKKKNPLK